MSAYRKGYRVEELAKEYMLRKYNAVCVRSGGSHGVADLICGNCEEVFAVQVKSGKRLPRISWSELEEFAKYFKATPMVLFKPDYREFLEARSEQELEEIREYLKNIKKKKRRKAGQGR